MKTLINFLVSKFVPAIPDCTIESEWSKPIVIVRYPILVQTHWCEVQTDLDEEIARA